MRVSDTKKRAGSVGVTAILLVGIGASYAFWTHGGSGTGAAETGTTEAIEVVQTTEVSGMGPGVAPIRLEGTFTNPGDATVHVTKLDARIARVLQGDEVAAGCDASDYELLGFSVPLSHHIEKGTNVGSWTGGTIQFKNKPDDNQDLCKGATVEIAYTVS